MKGPVDQLGMIGHRGAGGFVLTENIRWTPGDGWSFPTGSIGQNANLVFAFGDVPHETRDRLLGDLRRRYPNSLIVGCSSAGEIWDDEVHTETLCALALSFTDTRVRAFSTTVAEHADSGEAGAILAAGLPKEGLTHCMVFSDMHVEGAALARGVRSGLPKDVAVTGGLAGDAERFKETWVYDGKGCAAGIISLVGFYGSRLRVGYGSMGGWDTFGPDREITRAEKSTLYELDGVPALDLYERYLGGYASGLPATGLLFPLAVHNARNGSSVVRTILAVDRQSRSLTFAGEMPMGSRARLMRADFNRLVDGASDAAKSAGALHMGGTAQAAVLISCVGRRLILKHRIDEEVEAVRQVLGTKTAITGFYSYGELSPSAPHAGCELHNQTMTITTFSED